MIRREYRETEWPYNLCQAILKDDWEKSLNVEIDTLRATAEYMVRTCLRDNPQEVDLIFKVYRDKEKLKNLANAMGLTKSNNMVAKINLALRRIMERGDKNMLMYGIDNYILRLKIEGAYSERTPLMDPKNGSHRGEYELIETLRLMPRVNEILGENDLETVGQLLSFPNRVKLKENIKGLTDVMVDNIQRRLMVNGYYYEHLDKHRRSDKEFYEDASDT